MRMGNCHLFNLGRGLREASRIYQMIDVRCSFLLFKLGFNQITGYEKHSCVLALQSATEKHSGRVKLSCYSLSPLWYHSQQIPFRFMGLLWLLKLSHRQSSWPQRCDCGGGHYGSAPGLEMTRVRGWHQRVSFPLSCQSLPNFGAATRWRSWQRRPPLPSFSSQLNCCVQREISGL